MKLNDSYIVINKQGQMWTNLGGTDECIQETHPLFNELYLMYKLQSKKYVSDDDKRKSYLTAKEHLLTYHGIDVSVDEECVRQKLILSLQKLISFFSEFSFEPNFRFVNTLSNTLISGVSALRQYIKNYFELTDNSCMQAISDKMTSKEFSEIITTLILPSKHINTRFKLYYGSQGTGKTTQALMESNGRCMVCHSAMLPSDLMEDFDFDNGKAIFKPSALMNAMTKGQVIVLDEINLLPFESLRFLQSILDGKVEFLYKGDTIHIQDGFKIIGTMNLQVNGMIYALPEPLVDRAEELKKFSLNAEDLIHAIL